MIRKTIKNMMELKKFVKILEKQGLSRKEIKERVKVFLDERKPTDLED